MNENKKIVVWCGDAPNQRALANKIAGQFSLAGIVVDKKRNFKRPSLFKRLLPALQDRFLFKKVTGAWAFLQNEYRLKYPGWPGAPQVAVDTINSEDAFQFTRGLSPGLVVVSGTGLVKSKMLSLRPSIGIINLHTGLSPYIKGGPNCTNWCVATGQYAMIGNTIMWINEGIDAGNIITSECTPLGGARSLQEIQWKVMEHAHDLYLRAIGYLLDSTGPYNSIPQKEIAKGQLYLTKMWGHSEKRKLLNNLPSLLRQAGNINHEGIITVSLPNAR